MAARAPRPGDPRRAHLHSALAGRPSGERRDQVIYYRYRADRARRTLRGIEEQIAKAEKAVAGKTAIKARDSIAGGVPVDLREAVTGLDENDAVRAAAAVLHAAGHRDLRVAAGGERR